MSKILYLHGLHSSLSPEKREVLAPFGEIQAPAIDYGDDRSLFSFFMDECKAAEADFIIGSSMGGMAAFFLAGVLQKPALIFNPALLRAHLYKDFPKSGTIKHKAPLHVTLGRQDEIIPYAATLQYLKRWVNHDAALHINLRWGLAHRIPLPTFQQAVDVFFEAEKV